jgi:hemerythrin superfamily protein
MSTLTHTLHHEHELLLGHVENIRATARALPALEPTERDLRIDAVREFLRGTLLPHAEVEEVELYPRVAEILGHPRATAPMIHDHLAIRERLIELEQAPDDVVKLQEHLYGLHALIREHFRKEEELYLPLVE